MAIDDAGFREVFDRTLAPARRLATRITGDASLGDDLAAEALTRLFARWPRLKEEPWIDAWVMRVVTNLALSAVRRPIASSSGTDVVDGSDAVALRRTLVEALARLPRRQREVVVLRYLSDLSEKEVAAALGVSTGSVKTHLHRGLGALRAMNELGNEREVGLVER